MATFRQRFKHGGAAQKQREAQAVETILARLPDKATAPSLTILRNNFERDSGVFKILPAEIAHNKQTGEFIGGDYWNSTPPVIRLCQDADDSIVMHELRHHDQARQLRDKFNITSFAQYVRTNTFIEADSRAAEALLAIEKHTALMRLSEKFIIKQRHFKAPLPEDEHEILTLAQSLISSTERAECYLGAGKLQAIFNAHSQKGPVPHPLKMQIMRDVFDSYIAQCQDPDHIYRKREARRIRNFKIEKTSVFLWGLTLATAGLGAVYSLPAAIFLVAAQAALETLRIKKTFNLCAAASKAENVAIMTKIGTLPDGSGNYLTQTKGPALDSDFYHNIPPALARQIADKSAAIRRAQIPLATTIHNMKIRFLPGSGKKPPPTLPPPKL